MALTHMLTAHVVIVIETPAGDIRIWRGPGEDRRILHIDAPPSCKITTHNY
jgi:hypothetical protein